MQSVFSVIHLGRIRKNALLISRIAKRPLIAVVKDDAYGHGGAEVAHALEDIACGFAVSTVNEGAALRTAGVTKPILVFTPPLAEEEVLRIAAYRLTASLGSLHAVNLCKGITGVEAHLVVNTGMNRYGVRPEQIGRLCLAAKRAEICVTGMYSHLYAPEDGAARRGQEGAFEGAVRRVKQEFPNALCHLSATGGTLAGTKSDAIRIGIALYGYLPTGCGNLPVRPAMKVYATVADCRKPYGGGAGYGRAEKEYHKMHTLRVGYGDGFFRVGGLGIGNLCMDACIMEGEAKVGTKKLILSDAEKYASEHGTTAYEVLVNVGKKAERKYVY